MKKQLDQDLKNLPLDTLMLYYTKSLKKQTSHNQISSHIIERAIIFDECVIKEKKLDSTKARDTREQFNHYSNWLTAINHQHTHQQHK